MFFFLSALIVARASPVIQEERSQIVDVRVSDWDDSFAEVQRWSRDASGQWQRVGAAIPARIGRAGAAWGRGLHPAVPEGPQKVEGDGRAPAGVFSIGDAFGDALLIPAPRWPMRRVGPRDLWIEDASHPDYNRHKVVEGEQPLTAWEQSQRMRLGDAAHRLKIAVDHNAPPAIVAGAGSAIFVHIWRREGAAPTAGCTAMPAAAVEALIRWLDPDAAPLLVLLPDDVYARVQDAWGLPPR